MFSLPSYAIYATSHRHKRNGKFICCVNSHYCSAAIIIYLSYGFISLNYNYCALFDIPSSNMYDSSIYTHDVCIFYSELEGLCACIYLYIWIYYAWCAMSSAFLHIIHILFEYEEPEVYALYLHMFMLKMLDCKINAFVLWL